MGNSPYHANNGLSSPQKSGGLRVFLNNLYTNHSIDISLIWAYKGLKDIKV
jgi:hypothetical protein